MNSIFYRVYSRYFLIIIFLSSVLFFFSYNLIRTTYIETLTGDLERLGTALSENIETLIELDSSKPLEEFVHRKGRELDTRITIIDSSGTVLADSRKDASEMENHKNRPEIISAMQGQIGHSLRFSDTVHERMLYVARPLIRDGQSYAILRLSLYLRDIQVLLNTLLNRALTITLIFIIAASIVSIFFSKQLSRPIRDLVTATRLVAQGEFDVEIPRQNWGEIRTLANNFNEMVRQIHQLFSEISRQKEELITVISSIQEAIVVIRPKGLVLLHNDSFLSLTGLEELPQDIRIHELIQNDELNELISAIRKDKTSIQSELTFGGRHFLVSLSYIKTSDFKEIVILFHDISQFRQLERIKRDFIVNVSHELRTPLTSIKGFVETLMENDNPETIHQLRIIERNTNRMINLVEDLLVLAELEESHQRIKFEQVDFTELIKGLIPIFKQKLDEKGLQLTVKNSGENVILEADPFRIEQLLINLIDNAIKYTESGQIGIRYQTEMEQFHIYISDTGIGIPPEDIGRIFERFYVIDKSRSRRVGGTGLGLSIVKHIVILHNGSIEVESKKKSGTTFHICLPRHQSV